GEIIYSSSAHSTLPSRQLITLNLKNLEQKLIPLAEADQGEFDQDGKLYFTRRNFQGSQTKRYKGGYNQDLWKFDGKNEATPLTADFEGTSKNPMLFEGRLYFLSDRDGVMNIWSMDLDGKDLKQHSFSKFWDLKEADLHDGKIVYQKMADIYTLDIKSGEEKVLDISIVSDFDQRRVKWEKNPMRKLEGIALSNDGSYLNLTARGRMFVTPAKGGRWSEVTRKSGIRYKLAEFAGKEDKLLFLSDESGEMEIWETDKRGYEEPKQLTKGSQNLITSFIASPDNSKIAFAEKDNRLLIYDRESDSQKEIAISKYGQFYDLSWSSDNKWLTYVESLPNSNSQVKLYNTQTEEIHALTTERFSSYDPLFSNDGKWLFFASQRNLKNSQGSPWGPLQPEPIYKKTEKLYALALQADHKWPFLEKTELDEESKEKDKKEDEKNKDSKVKDKSKKSDDKDKKEEEKPVEIKIELDGLSGRLYELPIKPNSFGGFDLTKTHIYYTQRGEKAYDLYALKMSNDPGNKAIKVGSEVDYFLLSANQKKIMVKKSRDIYVGEANGKALNWDSDKLSLKNWQFQINPLEDWEQMLNDAWRLQRDYFYDKNLHGVDWKMILEKHKPLISRVSDRFELDDLLASMVSELSALHTFVYGGEKRSAPNYIGLSFLGAKLVKDAEKGGYVIQHIYRNDPDLPEGLSPLDQPHLSIKEGDVIKKINGIDVMSVMHIQEVMLAKAGLQVRLDLENQVGESYSQVVKPISQIQERNLRYSDWEYARRQMVEEKSESRIGYIHLRAMSGRNFDEFVKGFYPVHHREGLIIDVRHNNGGNIDSWVLEKLMRKAWFYWSQRTGEPSWNMQYAFRGHMVVLIDAQTASDGEAFAEGFRRLGLGKVIGTRTWGGEIWLTSSNRLVDRGIATAAEFGVFDKEGKWLIEGIGVVPDKEVDNLPFETFNGKDRQLEAAVEHLQKLMEEEPIVLPKTPTFPDKSFKYKE
ncbi:MAG: S41 family peptidase, partial [Bacteroidia bacterium]|nr:S41 family peptidase [Bacteroidia bacterium]